MNIVTMPVNTLKIIIYAGTGGYNVSKSINYDNYRQCHSVAAEIANRFLQDVEDCFAEFIDRYLHFGPWGIIPRWIANAASDIADKITDAVDAIDRFNFYKKDIQACNERAQELLKFFLARFEDSHWYQFEYQLEWTTYKSGVPFPHAFVYLEIHWHDHKGNDNILYRRLDPYYGEIYRDWIPAGNRPHMEFPGEYIPPDFKPWF